MDNVSGTATAINRRNFFRLLGGGIAVALVPSAIYGGREHASAALLSAEDEGTIAAWIHIMEDGSVSVFTGKVEVGQNIRTSLAQVVAEELAVPVGRIAMVMGDTALTPFDAGTYGSRTTPYMGPQLRKAAASLREALVDMAAKEWGVDASSVSARSGKIVHAASSRALDYGQLTQGKKLLLPLNDDVALTPTERWTVAGTSVPKVNGRDFVTGKHRYTSDLELPGMLYAKILRPPGKGATLKAVDLEQARATPGVTVVQQDGLIGLLAADPQTAANALAKVAATWDTTPQPARADIFDYLKANAGAGRGEDAAQRAKAREAHAAAAIRLQNRFEVQYIAHVPLEPRAAVAHWEHGQLTVWTGTQRPFGVQRELVDACTLPLEQIRVIMPDTGSGYGGKHSGEAAVEAARLAMATGKPVKLVWTREEEFQWAYLRPAALIEVAASVDRDGTIASWEFDNYNAGNAGMDFPYRAQVKHTRFHPSRSPLNQGSYRALAATANAFAMESMMDDLARESRQDPLAFRLRHLDDERMKAVLVAAAERFGWTHAKAQAHGHGIACGFLKNSYIATCAEVAYDDCTREVDVVRLVAAYDCGAVVNPVHLESQVLGAILQGLGGALFEAIDFKDGRILNASLSSYRVPRFSDMPPLEIVQLNRKDLPPAGAGETPIVAVAPAIRNAIADATGTKLHHLPLMPNGFKRTTD